MQPLLLMNSWIFVRTRFFMARHRSRSRHATPFHFRCKMSGLSKMWGPAVPRPVWGTEDFASRGLSSVRLYGEARERRGRGPTYCSRITNIETNLRLRNSRGQGRAGQGTDYLSILTILFHKNLINTTDHHQSIRESIIYFVR
jgi:hypothetical protein